jgi:NAD-dependent dihydropyrimidine dehydrogenase PreA subunit
MRGGRGFCIFLCPAGALMNLAYFLGKYVPFTLKLKVKKERCTPCGICVKACPTLALNITAKSEKTLTINYHVCNLCMDCVKLCPMNALEYSKTYKKVV